MIGGISQNYSQHDVNNFYQKKNTSNVIFKATSKQVLSKTNVTKPIIFASIATFFSGLFALNKQNLTEGEQIAKKLNETMKYIESLPEYKIENFKKVTAGCHSQKVAFGPVKLNDGSEATITYNLMDYAGDASAIAKKTLTIKNGNSEISATYKKGYAYTSRYDIRNKLREELNSGSTTGDYYYDNKKLQFFNKKGKPIEAKRTFFA